MQVLYPAACGLDVHKWSVVACVLLTQPDGTVTRPTSTFGTMTADLLALEEWLTRLGVTHVAIESTGIYWRPVFNILEDEARTILLVNPQHLKTVPGRKTDIKLRHEVVFVAVEPERSGLNLVFCHQYPTVACG